MATATLCFTGLNFTNSHKTVCTMPWSSPSGVCITPSQIHFDLPNPFDSSSPSCSVTESISITSKTSPVESKSSPINQILLQLNFVKSENSPESVILKTRVPYKFRIMEEDIPIEYESEFEEELDNAIDQSVPEVEENDVSESLPPLKIEDLAAQLLIDGNKCFNLSADDERLILGSSVNKKKYGKSKEGVEKRFFETIEQYGNAELKQLLTVCTPGVGMLPERRFYTLLRGDMTEQKRIILGKCLLICALKWRNLTKREYGKPLQPSTWDTNLKTLFAKFNEQGIQFKHLKHFNKDGEFHAVLMKQWQEAMQDDPTFASGVGTSTIDYEADRKIREKYNKKEFDPFSINDGTLAFHDRMCYMVFVLGRYWLLRGRSEVAQLKWENLKFVEKYDNGKFVGYIELDLPWHKGNKLSLKNPNARKLTDVSPRIHPNENDPLCPHKFVTFYRSLCAPKQVRVFCAQATEKQLKSNRSQGLPYLYNENKQVGENHIAKITKEFACEMGFENWHKITNHSNRKLGVTTVATNAEKGVLPVLMKSARHKHLNTQLNYQLENEDMRKSYQLAMVGKHVMKPAEEIKVVKKTRFSSEAGDECSWKENSSVQDINDTYHDYNDKANILSRYQEVKDIASNVTDSSVLGHDTNNDTLVSEPSIRDVDTITTSDSQRKMKEDRMSLIPPVNSAAIGTLVAQNQLQNIQRNIFLPKNSDVHEWCDSSAYGYSKICAGYHGD
jgi:hypothetical protein